MLKTWLVCSLLHCNYENRPRTPRPPWTLFTTHSYQTHQGWALEYEKRAHYKNVENVIPRKKFGQPNFYLWLYLQVYSGRISWINFYTSRTKSRRTVTLLLYHIWYNRSDYTIYGSKWTNYCFEQSLGYCPQTVHMWGSIPYISS